MTKEERANLEVKKALYDKMSAEMERYREYLDAMTPDELQKHAYEFSLRQDILWYVKGCYLDSKYSEALLQLPNPLEAVREKYRDVKAGFSYQGTIRDSIVTLAEQIIEGQKEELRKTLWKRPVYLHSEGYAREHGESEQYGVSQKANVACRDAIDAAIKETCQGQSTDPDAVRQIVKDFGLERMNLVLATTVRQKQTASHFSNRNRIWAIGVPILLDADSAGRDRTCSFALRSHPAKVNDFINTARKCQIELSHKKQVPRRRKKTPVR